MKILTNIRFVTVAGIAQNLASFIDFVEHSKTSRVKIIGVDVSGISPKSASFQKGKFSLIVQNPKITPINKAVKSASSLTNLQADYELVIEAYRQAIAKTKPDVILINGTYYLPWCLLQASRSFSIPTIVHYHGSITKETSHWPEAKDRQLFLEMEKQFDNPNIFYIFASNLIKNVVENQIFGHSVQKHTILPNPVPLYFFKANPRGARKKIGIVGRWTRIKNPRFISRLARYNAKQGSEFSLHIVSDLVKSAKARRELGDLAIFKQPIDNGRLSRFYASMGVVISPSYFETYGNVAKEALASGVPALVSSQMGVAETFRELGLDDWIIDFDSVADVYEKIRQISGQKVCPAVRSRLQEKHSCQYIHSKMINIIKSV